jgi:hypothetical protein
MSFNIKMTSIVQKPSSESSKEISQVIESKSESTETKISLCDVMKSNTSSIIKKAESQVPIYLQQYSDLYTAYLHTFDEIFGTCYIAEKEFFDKLDIDQRTLKLYDNCAKIFKDIISSQIDTSTQLLNSYIKMRLSSIESFDRYAQLMMQLYSNTLSQFNLLFDNKK